MDVSEAVDSRLSVREFLRDPVDDNLISELLEKSARSASGGNLQPWKIYVINNEAMNSFHKFQGEWSDPDGQDLAPIKDSTVAVEIVLGLNYSYNMFFADYKVDDPRHDIIKDWFNFFYNL